MDQQIQGYRMSPRQRHLWRVQDPHSLFNTTAVLEVRGQLDRNHIAENVAKLSTNHEIMSLVFKHAPGMPFPLQVVEDGLQPDFKYMDWRDLDPKETAQHRIDQISRLNAHAFDRENGPLICIRLARLSDKTHLLFVCGCSLIVDAKSVLCLAKEIIQPPDAPLDSDDEMLQFIDISEWQNETLESEDGEEGRAYWKQYQLSLPENARLSLETNPVDNHVNTKSISRTLNPTWVQNLRVTYKDKELQTFLLAGWQAFLSCHSAIDEVVVGYKVCARLYEELDNAIGPLERTLPMRRHFDEALTFETLFQDTAKEMAAVEAWQEFFDPAQDFVGTEPANAFFPYVFEHHRLPPTQENGPLQTTVVELSVREEPFRLRLLVLEKDTELRVHLDYDAARFDNESIDILMDQYLGLLRHAEKDPGLRVAQLLDANDRAVDQLCNLWNGPQEPVEGLIHEVFERTAATRPKQKAVSYGSFKPDGTELEHQDLTYSELNRMANQLAHYLRKRAVGVESRVGISIHRSPETIIATLAVLKAGAAFVSLDPTYPKERLNYIAENGGINCLITTAGLADLLPSENRQLICLDREQEAIQKEPDQNLDIDLHPQNLAYVIYTSGSTGLPKGVLVTHAGLTNLAQQQRQHFDLTAESRILQFAPLNFDASVWEMIMPWTVGATFCISPHDQTLPGEALEKALSLHGITHVTLPPSALGVSHPDNLDKLQHLIVAGESCPLNVFRKWSPGRSFYNAYGPSEATVCASIKHCSPDLKQLPIGKPLGNTTVAVVTPTMKPAPIGITGELMLGGINLARGYLDKPGLTAERFVPNPWSETPGERLYKTGDLGRLLTNGDAVFLGRRDHQVKLHGYRIELGEIEATLTAHTAVREAAVILTRNTAHGVVLDEHRLTAFITLDERTDGKEELSVDHLRHFLENRLPRYMVPALILTLDEMPLAPTGKVDRKALASPKLMQTIKKAYVAPRNEDEAALSDILASVLGVEKFGIHDNFFEMGGHSLLATQVITRAREKFGVELSLRTLFEAPTIPELLARIEEVRTENEVALNNDNPSEEDLEEVLL